MMPELESLIDRLARVPRKRGSGGLFSAPDYEEIRAVAKQNGMTRNTIIRRIALRSREMREAVE